MESRLYLEIPTPDWKAVQTWLQRDWRPTVKGCVLKSSPTGSGVVVEWGDSGSVLSVLSLFVWSVQRTTYLRAVRWEGVTTGLARRQEREILQRLQAEIRRAFPYRFPALPPRSGSIFADLAPHYPQTVKYFQRFPNGEADLERVYWWEQRWRQNAIAPEPGTPCLVAQREPVAAPVFDLIYVGGALGALHAAAMARRGYRVCLIERLPFGRMNREWNISRGEFAPLIQNGLFTEAEFERAIACEYLDGFHKFFDENNPPQAKAPVLHTPTVLNVAIDGGRFLQICGEKLQQAGGVIRDRTEFLQGTVGPNGVEVKCRDARGEFVLSGRLLIDAMGSASPIVRQLHGDRPFDSVCPTVGAVLSGVSPEVWDKRYGDVLHSHGDVSRGRQLIWELFPGEGDDLTVYLFHYHQVHPENPGSLLELYEDFFHIFPEYRRCDLEKLTWKKPTFGYIPAHFTLKPDSRRVAFDRLLAIGDAASLQSPLVFTGFGSLVRNLPRLTDLLDVCLKYDLTTAADLNRVNAYQSNTAVTWLFSKGMMVPTGKHLPPERINAMLNTFFGVLGEMPPAVSDRFIKDRFGWGEFHRMALRAAVKNPAIIPWIWDLAGPGDLGRWLGSYLSFTLSGLGALVLGGWLPALVQRHREKLLAWRPRWALRWLGWSYGLNYSVGKPKLQ